MCPSKGFPETCSLLEVVIFSSSEVRLSEFIVYEFSYLFYATRKLAWVQMGFLTSEGFVSCKWSH